MHPKFFNPTYPEEDFNLSVCEIIQSYSFLVLHSLFLCRFPKDYIIFF